MQHHTTGLSKRNIVIKVIDQFINIVKTYWRLEIAIVNRITTIMIVNVEPYCEL